MCADLEVGYRMAAENVLTSGVYRCILNVDLELECLSTDGLRNQVHEITKSFQVCNGL